MCQSGRLRNLDGCNLCSAGPKLAPPTNPRPPRGRRLRARSPSMILEGMGYRLWATGNGFEALRWLEEGAYDLFIMDAKLSCRRSMARRSTGKCWRARRRGGPRVLFVSGFAESSDYEDALNTQDVPVLFKPFTIDELGAVLDRVLATV